MNTAEICRERNAYMKTEQCVGDAICDYCRRARAVYVVTQAQTGASDAELREPFLQYLRQELDSYLSCGGDRDDVPKF